MDDDFDSQCPDCKTTVHLKPGYEPPEDGRCWECRSELFDEAEEMLRKIDLIAAPDCRGHRRRDAFTQILNLTMTRRWQSIPSRPKSPTTTLGKGE